ncbi:MAG TPA: hypothetical protein VFV33_11015, partial [Gemmatimonadaceae bacterium]|nr:hypothetical protein [Gemmatimonadaceae bacterium]
YTPRGKTSSMCASHCFAGTLIDAAMTLDCDKRMPIEETMVSLAMARSQKQQQSENSTRD